MNDEILIGPIVVNDREYRIVKGYDFIPQEDCCTNKMYFEDLELVIIQMKVRFFFFTFWIDIKRYLITEEDTMIKQLAKAKKLLDIFNE